MTSARTITAARGGKWYGSYGLVCCVAHPDRTPSLIIADSDQTDDGILVHCFARCDWKDVKGELRAMGLLPALDPGQSARHQPRRFRPTNTQPNPEKQANIDRARKIWAPSLPATGTLAEKYLKGRGIAIALPPTIKFSPALKHGPTGLILPAMVAAFSGNDKQPTGVHRTYLRLDGSGRATVSAPKMALGRSPGDAVRLGPAEETLGVAEGIETGLSAMQLYGGAVWCACGSHIDKIALPKIVKHVRVYADNGEEGEKIAAKSCRAYQAQGRAVTIINPPSEYGDFNDILASAKEAAA